MTVRMKHVGVVNEKITKIQSSLAKLHIIIDFDRTLTHPSSVTSWGILKNSKALSSSFHEKTSQLYKKYHPMEIDPLLAHDVKYSAMEDWWNEAHALLLSGDLTNSYILVSFFCNQKKLPSKRLKIWFVQDIFRTEKKRRNFLSVAIRRRFQYSSSALVWAILLTQQLLKKIGLETSTFFQIICVMEMMELLTNLSTKIFIHLAKRFILQTVLHPLILFSSFAAFFAKEVVLDELHEDFAKAVFERKNVIVVGDSLGDCHMADGVAHDCVLKGVEPSYFSNQILIPSL